MEQAEFLTDYMENLAQAGYTLKGLFALESEILQC